MTESHALRVLHVAPTPFFSDRGCHIRIEGIVKALNRKGVQNIVCTYHHGRDRPNVDTRRIGTIEKYQDTKAGPNSSKYFADFKLFWLVCKTIRAFQPDIIHAHLHEGIVLGWAAKMATMRPRIPLVSDIQGSLVGELDSYGYFEGSKGLLRLFKWLEYTILRMPRHIFCSSISSMNLMEHHYDLATSHLTLLSDRVDVESLTVDTKQLEHKDVTVIYTGSLLAVKGLEQLLEVVEQLLAKRSDVRVTLVGYPVEETTAFLKVNGLEQQCHLTGRVNFEDLPRHLRQADIGVDPKLPGTGEGSGKILNYMAAGLPVVAFDSDNNRGFLGPQQDLVPDGSIEQFVQRIEFLIDHPEVRRQEGERNRRRVEQELTWDAGIPLVLKTYQEALGKDLTMASQESAKSNVKS
ncbi:MAG: glycosyltransferase family 4 protein [Arenicellales bacterium]|nr:glycosyltransferase family 4 protein [Arenicellales bacterium]